MDIQKIKALLSAIRLGSLSAAAEEFSYTPSAMSHMADSLEAEIGVKIIERTRQGVKLTDEGTELLPKLEALTRGERSLLDAAEKIRKDAKSELRIGTYSSISTFLLPEFLMSFRKEHPNIRVSITVSDYLRGWIDDGRCDAVLADEGALGEYEKIPIMEDRYVAVVPETIALFGRTVEREQLYSYPYVSTNETALKSYFDEARFQGVTRLDSPDNLSVISMVREGIGISVLPTLAVKAHGKGVRVLKLVPKISRRLALAVRSDSEVALDFAKFARNTYSKKDKAT